MLDGAYRWHLIRALAMPGVDGSIVKWFGTATDVEDQRTAREAAEAANRANAIHLGHHAVEEYQVGLPTRSRASRPFRALETSYPSPSRTSHR
jgi:hypothetical protein